MNILYQTEATSIGGRTGLAASFDGALRVRLAMPAALGGAGGEGGNPEQLFAAGYAACFLTAIKNAAAEEGTEIAEDANVTATVGVGTREDEPGLHLQVALGIDLPGLDRETAERIVAAAHRVTVRTRMRCAATSTFSLGSPEFDAMEPQVSMPSAQGCAAKCRRRKSTSALTRAGRARPGGVMT